MFSLYLTVYCSVDFHSFQFCSFVYFIYMLFCLYLSHLASENLVRIVPHALYISYNKENSFCCKGLQPLIYFRVGRPEEIASTVAYLLSDDASYLTGNCLITAGGFVLSRCL